MEDDEQFDKTEEPTPKRLEDAYKEGRVPKSTEVNTWFLLAASGVCIIYLLPYSFEKIKIGVLPFFVNPHQFSLGILEVQGIGYDLFWTCLIALAIPVSLVFTTVFISGFAQTYKALGWQNIKPKFGKLNPIKGFKNLVSIKSVIEMFKSLLKTLMLGLALYLAFSEVFPTIPSWINLSITGANYFFIELVEKLFLTSLSVFLIITGGDFWYQKYKFHKDMKMSLKQVKDEFKQTEGDLQMKSRIKEIGRKRIKEAIKSAIKEASVVITNPTHFAVALHWEEDVMQAPVVTAKGMDHTALLIREMAKDYKIPIVENPPLARALHKSIEVNQEIHPDQYQAVAELLRGVAELKQKQF